MDITCTNINFAQYGLTTTCVGYQIHVLIDDVQERVSELLHSISDQSWINSLEACKQLTFKARANATIYHISNNIISKVQNDITEEFGEFMVSSSAQDALEDELNHLKIPLAELLKEKIIGNPGFDFHTESSNEVLVFGEAKYSEAGTPRRKALKQIGEFIQKDKDEMELIILNEFCSENAMTNAVKSERGYCAAFSFNGGNIDTIFRNAINSVDFQNLLNNKELYLIAVEVS